MRCLLDEQTHELGRTVNWNAVEFDHVQEIMIASQDAVRSSRHSEGQELVVLRVATSDDTLGDNNLFRNAGVPFDVIDALIQRDKFSESLATQHVEQLGKGVLGNEKDSLRSDVIKKSPRNPDLAVWQS